MDSLAVSASPFHPLFVNLHASTKKITRHAEYAQGQSEFFFASLILRSTSPKNVMWVTKKISGFRDERHIDICDPELSFA
jgi:hypothetical protein